MGPNPQLNTFTDRFFPGVPKAVWGREDPKTAAAPDSPEKPVVERRHVAGGSILTGVQGLGSPAPVAARNILGG